MASRFAIPFVTSALLALASTAWAVDPIPGVYPSIDAGGDVDNGHLTASWELPLNGMHGAGDVLSAWSVAVGPIKCKTPPCEEWHFFCPIQYGPQVVQDNRDGGGTGTVVTTNQFMRGAFFLHKNGPWGDGVNHLTGTLEGTEVVVTEHFLGGVPQGSAVTLDAGGSFDGSNFLLRFQVASGTVVGNSDDEPLSLQYPDPMAPDCVGFRDFGWWGDLNLITMTIEQPVPALPSTWGRVKTLYR